MTNLFTPLTQIRETRQSTDLALRVPFAKKESYSTSFAVKGAYIWNNLNAQLMPQSHSRLFARKPLPDCSRLVTIGHYSKS